MDGQFLALLQPPAPESLQGRAVSGPFAHFERHHLRVKNIGHDLAPDLRLGPSAGGANLRGPDPQPGQPAQAVIHAQGHAFHGRPREILRRVGPLVDPEQDARPGRDVGGAFPLQIGQQHQAARTHRHPGDRGGKSLVAPAKGVPHHLGGRGHVHRTEQRQPMIGRIAKRGDLPLGIDDWLARAGVDRAARAEAGRDDAWARVARPDRPHHVVTAARADQGLRAQAQLVGGGPAEVAGRAVARPHGRELAAQLRVDGLDRGLGPLALLDVEQGRPAGVSIFHDLLSRQPEIKIIVRQQHGRQLPVILGLMFL